MMRTHVAGRTVLLLMCGVLFAEKAAAITTGQWTGCNQPHQQVYVLGVLDA
jgi:hypothetical protein